MDATACLADIPFSIINQSRVSLGLSDTDRCALCSLDADVQLQMSKLVIL